jgi:hypothetical protein
VYQAKALRELRRRLQRSYARVALEMMFIVVPMLVLLSSGVKSQILQMLVCLTAAGGDVVGHVVVSVMSTNTRGVPGTRHTCSHDISASWRGTYHASESGQLRSLLRAFLAQFLILNNIAGLVRVALDAPCVATLRTLTRAGFVPRLDMQWMCHAQSPLGSSIACE